MVKDYIKFSNYFPFLILGLSLDACIKLKETKKLRAVGEQPSKHRRRRKRKQQAKQKAESSREPVSSIQLVVFIPVYP